MGVKRNIKCLPNDSTFQLNKSEFENPEVTNCDIKLRRYQNNAAGPGHPLWSFQILKNILVVNFDKHRNSQCTQNKGKSLPAIKKMIRDGELIGKMYNLYI